MILALLILIVFILLFGAGVVKGFLMNAAALVTGFIILIALVLWLGSFFGEDGPMYVILGGGGLLTALGFWIEATKPQPPVKNAAPEQSVKPPLRFHSQAPSREERKRMRGR